MNEKKLKLANDLIESIQQTKSALDVMEKLRDQTDSDAGGNYPNTGSSYGNDDHYNLHVSKYSVIKKIDVKKTTTAIEIEFPLYIKNEVDDEGTREVTITEYNISYFDHAKLVVKEAVMTICDDGDESCHMNVFTTNLSDFVVGDVFLSKRVSEDEFAEEFDKMGEWIEGFCL